MFKNKKTPESESVEVLDTERGLVDPPNTDEQD